MIARQARIGVDLLTGAVVVSVAFALAGLTWRLAGDSGTGLGAAPVAVPPPPLDLAPAIAAAPFGSVVAQAPVATASGALKLRGILFANPASSSTALIAIGDGPAKGYRAGDPVGGSVVASIAIDHVVLRGAGAQVLAMANRAPAATATIAATARVAAPPATPTAPPASAAASPKPSAEADGIAAIRALIPAEARGDPPKPPAPAATPTPAASPGSATTPPVAAGNTADRQ